MAISLSIPAATELKPRILVFGVGGAGGNAVNNMISAQLGGVDFVVANTDAQALMQSQTENRIQLGSGTTQGLGAGSRPEIGRAAAEEAMDKIVSQLEGCNMCFITAGMGGGTGTGASPVVARVARELGLLTVGVVTKPFQFEGAHRMAVAESGIVDLQQYVDTLIVIPNQNLFRIANEKTTFADAFGMADDVLHAGVRGVTDLMVMPGLINLDFADVRTVMSEMGKAMMGTGEASGEDRAVQAAEAAISNPLLDDVSLKGARGVLINITGGNDLTLYEVDEAANKIRNEVDPDANIIVGSTFDDEVDGYMRVSVVATGIEGAEAVQPQPAVSQRVVAAANVGARPAAAADRTEPPREAVTAAVAERRPPQPVGADFAATEPAVPDVAAVASTEVGEATEAGRHQVAAQHLDPEPAEAEFQQSRQVVVGIGERDPVESVVAAAPRPRPSEAQSGTLKASQRSGPRSTRNEPTLFERITGVGRARSAANNTGESYSQNSDTGTQRDHAGFRPRTHMPETQPAKTTAAAPVGSSPISTERPGPSKADEHNLDIPAFLRRQAN